MKASDRAATIATVFMFAPRVSILHGKLTFVNHRYPNVRAMGSGDRMIDFLNPFGVPEM